MLITRLYTKILNNVNAAASLKKGGERSMGGIAVTFAGLSIERCIGTV